ncbi:hypothetical protein V6N13_116700 [Hibiscus sabdariffa]
MIEGKAQWDERKVKQVFMERDAQIILQCPIASMRDDVFRWSHHSSGLYVTKTAHHWLEKQGNHNEGSSELWQTLARMDKESMGSSKSVATNKDGGRVCSTTSRGVPGSKCSKNSGRTSYLYHSKMEQTGGRNC